MRTLGEVLFRARQEVTNAYLLWRKPEAASQSHGQAALPRAADIAIALRGSAFADEVLALADKIVNGIVPMFGCDFQLGSQIRWRRDYAHQKESGLSYFRRVPYLEFAEVGDHKFIWELNRHQHLVVLAQASLLTGDERYELEVYRQLEDWTRENPFQRGINWASALEVAFRASSWLWISVLLYGRLPEGVRKMITQQLHWHALHLETNLSVYFSPNTHLLGEAVVLYAIAALYPEMIEAPRWARISEKIIIEQLSFQVRADGSHFEQSSYYHIYALDFFLFFYILAGRPPQMRSGLERMAEYLASLSGSGRQIFLWGDDDGGRLFHPYGDRRQFGRSTLATCGYLFQRPDWMGQEDDLHRQAIWWIGKQTLPSSSLRRAPAKKNLLFKESGMVFLANENWEVQFDCGPLGFAGAGHSHSDSLSLCATWRGQELLIDPGTYTYVGEPEARRWFRGSMAHNTVLIAGRDQGVQAGPFRWASKPEVELIDCGFFEDGGGWARATCQAQDSLHRRTLLLEGSELIILDEITGTEPLGRCDQRWHFAKGAESAIPVNSSAKGTEESYAYSPVYGTRTEAPGLSFVETSERQVEIATVFSEDDKAVTVEGVQERLRKAGVPAIEVLK